MSDVCCWLYHPVHGARLFKTTEDIERAGSGWEDSPNKPEKPEPPKKQRVIEAEAETPQVLTDVESNKSPVDIVAELPQLDPVTFVPKANPDEPLSAVVDTVDDVAFEAPVVDAKPDEAIVGRKPGRPKKA